MTLKQNEIIEALTAGTARRRFTKCDEAWYAAAAVHPRMKRDGTIRTWSVGVDAVSVADGRGNGTHGEWTLEWVDLGSRWPSGALRIATYVDGVAAMAASGFQPGDLAEIDDPAAVEAYLTGLGFTDLTLRTNPYASTGA